MHLFFAENIQIKDNTFLLTEQEAHHCNVLRINKNEIIGITDGSGVLIKAKLINRDKNHCLFKILDIIKNYHKRKYFLHIAIAPTKNIDRFEFFVEKAVELGIDRITPLYTARTERKRVKIERLEKIAIAAMKQSKNTFKPQIDPLTEFKNFVNSQQLPENKFIALCQSTKTLFEQINTNTNNFLVIIGPEGGFTDEEIKFSLSKNITPIRLSSNTLRTETAGIFVASNFILKF